jgi:hypothetical protein
MRARIKQRYEIVVFPEHQRQKSMPLRVPADALVKWRKWQQDRGPAK